MKIITLILNCLIVYVSYWTSGIILTFSMNQAGYVLESKRLAPITAFCFHNGWILWAIPLAWGVASLLLSIKKFSLETTLLHTSASVFWGCLFFSFLQWATCCHLFQ
ncbi:MAG: hypothetical protein FWF96_06670 [Kiritimatiellaeota bacterium]|nr:hypothetical protein [Kiritimatiellota bacterium]